jgi:hypothetical protein
LDETAARALSYGDPLAFDRDESVRGETTIEALRALKPAFKKRDGGQRAPVNDGAAAVVAMSAERAEVARSLLSGSQPDAMNEILESRVRPQAIKCRVHPEKHHVMMALPVGVLQQPEGVVAIAESSMPPRHEVRAAVSTIDRLPRATRLGQFPIGQDPLLLPKPLPAVAGVGLLEGPPRAPGMLDEQRLIEPFEILRDRGVVRTLS